MGRTRAGDWIVNPHDLIRLARQLASGDLGSGRGRPRQAELRRAVSTAYYALFHALALSAADLLIGPNRNSRIERLWLQIYRSLEHGYAKNQCQNQAIGQFPSAIQDFAANFIELQGNRHDADYNPSRTFTRHEVQKLIDESEASITAFENASEQDRRAFAVYVLFRPARR